MTAATTAGHAATLTDSYDEWVAHVGSQFNTTDTLGSQYDFLPTVSLTGGGSFAAADTSTGASVGVVRTIGDGWGTWSGSYGGQVLSSEDKNGDPSNNVTLSLSGLSAIGFEVQPYSTDGMYYVTVALSSGQTVTDYVSGFAGAQFFGAYGGQLTSLTISTTDNDFAFGDFVSMPSTVPLPGGAPLFGSALVILGAFRFALSASARQLIGRRL